MHEKYSKRPNVSLVAVSLGIVLAVTQYVVCDTYCGRPIQSENQSRIDRFGQNFTSFQNRQRFCDSQGISEIGCREDLNNINSYRNEDTR